MAQLNPYLMFDGNCREAMEFYRTCLGGELSIMTVGQSPMKDDVPPEVHNQVLHSMLQKDNMVFMASDKVMPGPYIQGNTVTLCINGGSLEELRPLFTQLSAGGTMGHELKAEFFGIYGDFVDKFGMNWVFQTDNA